MSYWQLFLKYYNYVVLIGCGAIVCPFCLGSDLHVEATRTKTIGPIPIQADVDNSFLNNLPPGLVLVLRLQDGVLTGWSIRVVENLEEIKPFSAGIESASVIAFRHSEEIYKTSIPELITSEKGQSGIIEVPLPVLSKIDKLIVRLPEGGDFELDVKAKLEQICASNSEVDWCLRTE